MSIETLVTDYLPVTSGDIKEMILRTIFSIGIIVVGIFLGRLLDFSLKKLSEKLDLNKHIRGSFLGLIFMVVRWSVYIIFLNLALDQLGIPALTKFFTTILITIPAFVGGIILIVIGFSLAYYLKLVILNSEIKSSNSFSKIVFYFVCYMFGIYSIKTALISFEPQLTNNILLIFTTAFFISIAYLFIKKDKIEHQKYPHSLDASKN